MHERTPSIRLWFGVMVFSLVLLWGLLGRDKIGNDTETSASVSAPSARDTQSQSQAAPPTEIIRAKMHCQDLFHTACQRRGITSDPSGEVQPNIRGEIEALRLYEEIIHLHPDWTSDEVDEELVKNIYTDKRRRKLLDTFQWVVQEIKRIIEQQPVTIFSADLKKKLKARIDSTFLELPPPASLYSSEPDLFTKNEMYFESLQNGRRVIRVGGAYLLTVKSWFNRVFTLSHELAHSIDPCELRASHIEPAAYRRLARCFHQKKIVQGDSDRVLCSTKNQLGEAFADWVATEVTAHAMERYREKFKNHEDQVHAAINAVRDLCDQEFWVTEADREIYPDPAIRIGKIFAENPKIKSFLNCEEVPNESPYCAF